MIWNREPVMTLAVIAAGIFLLTEFGVPLTEGQETGIQGFAAAVLAWLARSQVTPVSQLNQSGV